MAQINGIPSTAWADRCSGLRRQREVEGESKVQQQAGGHAQRQGDDVPERAISVTFGDVPHRVAVMILVQQPPVSGRAAPQEIEAEAMVTSVPL
jgi:hypothetical protein